VTAKTVAVNEARPKKLAAALVQQSRSLQPCLPPRPDNGNIEHRERADPIVTGIHRSTAAFDKADAWAEERFKRNGQTHGGLAIQQERHPYSRLGILLTHLRTQTEQDGRTVLLSTKTSRRHGRPNWACCISRDSKTSRTTGHIHVP